MLTETFLNETITNIKYQWLQVITLPSVFSYMMLIFISVLTQIPCNVILFGVLQLVAVWCGYPSTRSTSPRCSATSPAKPWDMPRCEASCSAMQTVHHRPRPKVHALTILLTSLRSLYLNMVGLWVTVSLAMLSGLTMYSVYKKCDPFTNGDVGSTDQVTAAASLHLLASTNFMYVFMS